MKASCTNSIFGFTFRKCENKCNTNHSNYASIYNFKLSIIPQYSKQKCFLTEDSNSIRMVHHRSAFVSDPMVVYQFFHQFWWIYQQQCTWPVFFSIKSEHFDVYASTLGGCETGTTSMNPNILHMVEHRILFWFLQMISDFTQNDYIESYVWLKVSTQI